jgi:predicted RNase H-like nuclease (RuvC/YqgF family)
VQSVARAKTEIAAAQKELDKLKDEITTLQNRAEQAEKLEKEILKKDKRIWQLWAVLIGTGSMVGLWILMKLGLFAAKFRPFFLL